MADEPFSVTAAPDALKQYAASFKPACSKCQWWDTGVCRRAPPQAAPLLTPTVANPNLNLQTVWPFTKAEDWCGEFSLLTDVDMRWRKV